MPNTTQDYASAAELLLARARQFLEEERDPTLLGANGSTNAKRRAAAAKSLIGSAQVILALVADPSDPRVVRLAGLAATLSSEASAL